MVVPAPMLCVHCALHSNARVEERMAPEPPPDVCRISAWVTGAPPDPGLDEEPAPHPSRIKVPHNARALATRTPSAAVASKVGVLLPRGLPARPRNRTDCDTDVQPPRFLAGGGR